MLLPFHRFQAAGDIVFVKTYQLLPINRLAQLLATARLARHTHVLLCVMPGLFIHAVPHSGVGFLAAENDKANFPSQYKAHWEVRRNTALSSDLRLSAKVSARASYYIGQSYNGAFRLSKYLPADWGHSHSFCSELIARIYRDLDLPITTRDPEKVLPLHLELATRNDQRWQTVTSEYQAWFSQSGYCMNDVEALDSKLNDATRFIYADSVRVLLNSSVAFKQAVPAFNAVNAVMPSSYDQFQRLSDLSKARLFALFDMNQDSYRDLRKALLDGIFLLDEQLSALAQPKPDSEPVNWVMKTGEQPDFSPSPDSFYDKLAATIERSQLLIREAAAAVFKSIEIYLTIVPYQVANGPLSEDLAQHARNILDQSLSLLDGIENFAGYDSDLKALAGDIQSRLAGQVLKTEQGRTLLRGMVRELRYRQILRNKIRPGLDRLRQNLTDKAAAYELYGDLLTFVV